MDSIHYRRARSPFFLAITGGSGSGKTTLAHSIAAILAPKPVIIISEDNYYFDHAFDENFDPATFNFDDISAHEHVLLQSDLLDLRGGKTVNTPIYNFKSHTRAEKRQEISPAELIIVEGMHLLFLNEIRCLFDFSIYVDTPDDIRLLRRIKRDVMERNRPVDSILAQYLKTVRPMHYKYVLPTRILADLIIETEINSESWSSSSLDLVMNTLRKTINNFIENFEA